MEWLPIRRRLMYVSDLPWRVFVVRFTSCVGNLPWHLPRNNWVVFFVRFCLDEHDCFANELWRTDWEVDHMNRFFIPLDRPPGYETNVSSKALVFFFFFFPRGAAHRVMKQPFSNWWVGDFVNHPFSLYPRQKGSPSRVPHPGWCLVNCISPAPATDNEGCARDCGLLTSHRMPFLRKRCLPYEWWHVCKLMGLPKVQSHGSL